MSNSAEIIKFPSSNVPSKKKAAKKRKKLKLKKLTFFQKIEDKADPWEIFNVTVAVVAADLIIESIKALLRFKGLM